MHLFVEKKSGMWEGEGFSAMWLSAWCTTKMLKQQKNPAA